MLKVSGLEWVSLGQYLVWLEQKLDLVPINSDKVWSMAVVSNVANLYRSKCKLCGRVKDNKSSITEFLLLDGIEDGEMAVCVSMIGNYDYYLEILESQLVHLEQLVKIEKSQLNYVDLAPEEIKDEIPF